MTPQQFINKWKPVALTERATAQSHFIDLCALLGHDDPIKADPTGESFTFEKGVTKTGGGDGFADVWKKGFFAWEYKKKKHNLDDALGQLVRYAAALENPPLQVACDTDRFLIRTAWTNAVPKTYAIALDDLANPKSLDVLHSVFFDPEKLRPKETRAGLTREAADKFSTIAFRLEGRGKPEDVAHFVNQLVFCYFAHSVKLLPNGFFPKLLKRASENPTHATQYFNNLFAAMEKGGDFDLTKIAHFNGGLFDGRGALPLDSTDIALLVAAASLDWSQIDPSIFGTLFERFLDPEKRGQIGAHYTDADKIMMIVDPVIIRPLAAEWLLVKTKIEALLTGEQKPPMRAKERRRMTPQEAAEEVRSLYLERLRTLTILDPACGSGNFLYIALQAVKDLELKANHECEAFGLSPRTPAVGPEILRGIEINPLAAELARTTIWIGDIQWGIRNAIYARPEPILRPLDAIECRDAVIRFEQDGSAIEAKWPEAEFIIGNPPFLGSRKMKPELGADHVESLRKLYVDSVANGADYVCYWFAKAWNALKRGSAKRVGLLATKAITGGASRRVLQPIADAHGFFEVWRDEPWVVEGAAVRVAVICVSIEGIKPIFLDGLEVAKIYSDLRAPIDGRDVDLTKARKLTQNRNVAFQGVVPRSSLTAKKAKKLGLPNATFVLPGPHARQLLQLPLNPNGRPNSDVIVPFLVGDDITSRPLDRFIVDFKEMDESASALYQEPFAYIQSVKLHRRKMTQADALVTWWQHWRSRPEMRRAVDPLKRFLVTPRVAKHRFFVWTTSPRLADNAVVVIARDDDTCFGILQSRFHESWSLRKGTALEDRPRYTPTSTFETFPFPEGLTLDIPAKDYSSDKRAIAIAKAARRLDQKRNKWLNPPDIVRIEQDVVPDFPPRILPKDVQAAITLKERTLTNLYNKPPQWLVDAHRELDEAVAVAYGWPADISEGDSLAELLDLNLSRAATSTVGDEAVDEGENGDDEEE